VVWSVAAALVVALVVVVVVVRNRPRDPAFVQADADLAYALTVGSADQVARMVEEVHPDVSFVDPSADRPAKSDLWNRCDDGHVDGVTEPRAITWTSIRGRWSEPKRETATLLPPVIEALHDEGWEVTREYVTDSVSAVDLRRSGFGLHLSGLIAVHEEHPSAVSISITSPCIDAPAGQSEWEWTPGPTEAPWPEERGLGPTAWFSAV
jgi:hypothetical protein